MAQEYAPASNVSLIVCTAPVWTALLLSLAYRGERMTRRQIAGSALAFAGMVLVVLNDRFVLHLSPKAICWPCPRRCCRWSIRWRSNASEALPRRFHHPQGLLLRTADDSSGIRLPALLGRRGGAGASRVWGNLLFLGIIASMLCYMLWNAAMHRLGAVRPRTTSISTHWSRSSRPRSASANGSPRRLAGAALILYGMWRAERA